MPVSPVARPRHTSLVLSGGNALGAYAAGAYEALDRAGVRLDLIGGASIGAIQAAIIAGNRPEERLDRLRAFWDTAALGSAWWPAPRDAAGRDAYNRLHAFQTLVGGRIGLFAPRVSGRWSMLPGTPPDIGLFDSAPMVATLERLVDFDRLNDGPLPIVVTSVDLASGESIGFDSRLQRIDVRHLLASSAFIPGFPPVEIDGRLCGDPGMVCNLPLDPVLGAPFEVDQLCFAVDLFDREGEPPASMDRALERAQDIAFAAQSIRTIEAYRREHRLRHRLAALDAEAAAAVPTALGLHPAGGRAVGPAEVDLVLVAYRAPRHETGAKTLDFSTASIAERWTAGRDDMGAAIDRLRSGSSVDGEPGFRFHDARRREGG